MQRERSPEGDAGPDRKRRRKVLSCTDCRRRKVQCDRGNPACGRCERAGKMLSCTYEEEALPLPADRSNGQYAYDTADSRLSNPGSVTISKEVWDDLFNRILQQERTIERLSSERRSPFTRRAPSYATTSQQLEDPTSSEISENAIQQESILFRGKGFKTFFYGASDARSSLALIPEAISTLRDVISQSPALVRAQRDIESLRNVRRAIEKAETHPEDEDLTSLLPARSEVDYLVQIYLEQVDTLYGVLHVPSFQREYLQFWRNPRASRPAFTALLCLMIACCQCLPPNMPLAFVADSAKRRETVVRIVNTCDRWLAKQSRKHVDMTYFQIHYILVLAKQINSIKLKRTWTEVGNLLRLAMAAGMHRSCSLMQKKTSVFYSEMRRRFWALVVEMDLQASLDRGMPASALDIVSDCGMPSNLRDEDFDESTTTLPPSRPATDFTKMSYLCISNNSRELRKRLTNMLNQPGHGISYSTVRTHTERIEQQLSALPSWRSFGLDQSHKQSAALLRIQLQQFLLILHASAARRATTVFEASFSKTAFFSAAKSVVHCLSELSVLDMNLLIMSRYDLMSVFVTLAHLGISTARSATTPDISNELQPWLELAAQTLDLFENRILRSGPMQWSYCFALFDSLQRFVSPSVNQADTRLGCDKIYNICRKMLDFQDPAFALAAAEYEKSTGIVAPRKTASYGDSSQSTNTFAPEQAICPANGTVSTSTSNPDLSEWNFDDWMLYSDTFFQQNLEMAEEALPDMLSYAQGVDLHVNGNSFGDQI